jgi:hypothetical protein
MYRPQHSKRKDKTDHHSTNASSPCSPSAAQAPPAESKVRRRSTVDTPYSINNKKHPHSHSEPDNSGPRKSWAETDWEELEKMWSRERNESSDKLTALSGGSDVIHKSTAANLDVKSSTQRDWRDPDADLFLQFFMGQEALQKNNEGSRLKSAGLIFENDLEEEEEELNKVVVVPRAKSWRRRVTI